MARRKEDPPLTMPQIRGLVQELGEPFWAPGQPDYAPPKKGSVEYTACQTPNCAGQARHWKIRWLWESNSFYCMPCLWKRGAIATLLTTALILTGGLILMILARLLAS